MKVQPAASVQFDPPDVSSEQKSKISCKTWQSFFVSFLFLVMQKCFLKCVGFLIPNFSKLCTGRLLFFFLHLQREGSQAEWQQEPWVTHFLKNSGKARVGGLSPNFIYVRFINKHTALLLGVPGAVWGHSLFCRFSPAVSRSPVCPLPPPCPPAAPGAICRVPSVDEDGVTTGWPGGSLRQPQSPSSVLSRRRKSFSKCQLHREFL